MGRCVDIFLDISKRNPHLLHNLMNLRQLTTHLKGFHYTGLPHEFSLWFRERPSIQFMKSWNLTTMKLRGQWFAIKRREENKRERQWQIYEISALSDDDKLKSFSSLWNKLFHSLKRSSHFFPKCYAIYSQGTWHFTLLNILCQTKSMSYHNTISLK